MSHIIYDIYFEKRENITYESKYGTQLIQNLVKLNNHKLLSEPIIYQFPCPKLNKNVNNDDCNYNGYTGFGILMESHISIHTYPEKNKISIDIYSCKMIDLQKNLIYIQYYFKNSKHKIFYNFLLRN